jgi:hypothetical protein
MLIIHLFRDSQRFGRIISSRISGFVLGQIWTHIRDWLLIFILLIGIDLKIFPPLPNFTVIVVTLFPCSSSFFICSVLLSQRTNVVVHLTTWKHYSVLAKISVILPECGCFPYQCPNIVAETQKEKHSYTMFLVNYWLVILCKIS